VLPLDAPNPRSLHNQPTQKGGGIAIVGLIILASVNLMWWDTGSERIFMALGISALIFGVLGLWDDHRDLGVRVKLLFELATGVIVIWLVDLPRELEFSGVTISYLSVWLVAPIVFLWFIWMTNLYNFMDGVDGLVGSQSIFSLIVVAGWFLLYGDASIALFCVAIAGAGIGFLILNWHPARLFLGDAGSLPLGAVFALLAVYGASKYQMPVTAFLLLYGICLFDATVTLGRRFFSAERWWEAHSNHFYQRAVRSGVGHARLSIFALLASGLLAGLGTLDMLRIGSGLLWFPLGLILAGSLMIWVWKLEQRFTLR
jgi:UDP-N-acetylmuramyl pentapeptide phosphotransferase/UDP-N-acetylglucosamine-1-phosphate transferase